jgi:type IV pilus assembly protein PilV
MMTARARATMRRARTSRRRRRAGYSLISTMMAMVILAIGVMALAGASTNAVTVQTMAQNRTHAISIARSHLETLRMGDPWDVETEAAVAVDADGAPSGDGGFRRAVTVTELRRNLMQVVVTVEFPNGNAPVVLTTTIFRGAQVQ